MFEISHELNDKNCYFSFFPLYNKWGERNSNLGSHHLLLTSDKLIRFSVIKPNLKVEKLLHTPGILSLSLK